MTTGSVTYRRGPQVRASDLRDLFVAAWPDGTTGPSPGALACGAGYVCAFAGDALIGFVNVAWDGGVHGFILDTTVHPAYRRRGIGRDLVAHAVDLARDRGVTWLHVDYTDDLGAFYRACGFHPTAAGLMDLRGQR